jgi:hypothetical protein
MYTEAIVNVAVAGIGMVFLLTSTQHEMQATMATSTGQYMSNVARAIDTYTFDNTTLLATSPTSPTEMVVGTKSVTVENPLEPTIDDLVNLGLLPIGFSKISPLKLQFTAQLMPTNCPGATCTIPGRLYSTTGYLDTNHAVRNDLMAKAVLAAGQDAGVSYAGNPGTVTGLAATWLDTNPLGNVPGVLMMRVGFASLLANDLDQFYKRDGTLNLTDDMPANNKSIGNADNVQANGTVQGAQVSSTGNMNALGSVSANGNVSAAGSLLGGSMALSGNAAVNGVVQAGSVDATSVVASATVTGQVVTSRGAVNTAVGGGFAVENTSCAGQQLGAFLADNTGRPQFCLNDGLWHSGLGGGAVGAVIPDITTGAWIVGICSDSIWTSYNNLAPQVNPPGSNGPGCPANMPYFYKITTTGNQTGNTGG